MARIQESLSHVDDIQAGDIFEYLTKLKKYGHRGQTNKELIAEFIGTMSSRAIYYQLERLVKGKQIRIVKIKYKRHELVLYEAI